MQSVGAISILSSTMGSAISPDAAWDAVLRRDRDSDGEFVFAVRTTGIFCRPSCPARRPKREHVEFLPSAEIARAAGYRACKRCNPESAARTLGEKRVKAAARYIEAHPAQPISLDQLASQVKLSPFHLQREFKRAFGLTPRAYQTAVRTSRLKARLGAGDSVTRAGYEAGFGSSRAVYETAAKTMGMTPGEYRRGAPGLRIRYDFTESPIGTILVAATAKGICAVSLGDDKPALEKTLVESFPGAILENCRGQAPDLRRWAESVAALASGRGTTAPPLDLQGSAFQLRVWKALQQIPLGETQSYAEIAEHIGARGAARAVGRACATNPAALVVPCHRVVQTSGALGGYRWGLDRKRSLLEAEKRRSKPRLRD